MARRDRRFGLRRPCLFGLLTLAALFSSTNAPARTVLSNAAPIPGDGDGETAKDEEYDLVKRILIERSHHGHDDDLANMGILSRLRDVYVAKIKPIQDQFRYEDLGRETLGEADIFSKPVITFLGPAKTGKTSLLYHLLGDADEKHEDQSGGTAVVYTYGSEHRNSNGSVLLESENLPFQRLNLIDSNAVCSQVKVIELPSPILKRFILVDTMGKHENESIASEEGEILSTMVQKSDLLIFVVDPNALTTGSDMDKLLKKVDEKRTRLILVLNKMTRVSESEFVDLYGKCLWLLEPLVSFSSPPKIFMGSFGHVGDYSHGNESFFHQQERSYLQDIDLLSGGQLSRKVRLVLDHSRRLKLHTYVIDRYLHAFSKSKSKIIKDLLRNPQKYAIYEAFRLKSDHNVDVDDFPKPKEYERFFKINPIDKLEGMMKRCRNSYCSTSFLDELLAQQDMGLLRIISNKDKKWKKKMKSDTKKYSENGDQSAEEDNGVYENDYDDHEDPVSNAASVNYKYIRGKRWKEHRRRQDEDRHVRTSQDETEAGEETKEASSSVKYKYRKGKGISSKPPYADSKDDTKLDKHAVLEREADTSEDKDVSAQVVESAEQDDEDTDASAPDDDGDSVPDKRTAKSKHLPDKKQGYETADAGTAHGGKRRLEESPSDAESEESDETQDAVRPEQVDDKILHDPTGRKRPYRIRRKDLPAATKDVRVEREAQVGISAFELPSMQRLKDLISDVWSIAAPHEVKPPNKYRIKRSDLPSDYWEKRRERKDHHKPGADENFLAKVTKQIEEYFYSVMKQVTEGDGDSSKQARKEAAEKPSKKSSKDKGKKKKEHKEKPSTKKSGTTTRDEVVAPYRKPFRRLRDDLPESFNVEEYYARQKRTSDVGNHFRLSLRVTDITDLITRICGKTRNVTAEMESKPRNKYRIKRGDLPSDFLHHKDKVEESAAGIMGFDSEWIDGLKSYLLDTLRSIGTTANDQPKINKYRKKRDDLSPGFREHHSKSKTQHRKVEESSAGALGFDLEWIDGLKSYLLETISSIRTTSEGKFKVNKYRKKRDDLPPGFWEEHDKTKAQHSTQTSISEHISSLLPSFEIFAPSGAKADSPGHCKYRKSCMSKQAPKDQPKYKDTSVEVKSAEAESGESQDDSKEAAHIEESGEIKKTKPTKAKRKKDPKKLKQRHEQSTSVKRPGKQKSTSHAKNDEQEKAPKSHGQPGDSIIDQIQSTITSMFATSEPRPSAKDRYRKKRHVPADRMKAHTEKHSVTEESWLSSISSLVEQISEQLTAQASGDSKDMPKQQTAKEKYRKIRKDLPKDGASKPAPQAPVHEEALSASAVRDIFDSLLARLNSLTDIKLSSGGTSARNKYRRKREDLSEEFWASYNEKTKKPSTGGEESQIANLVAYFRSLADSEDLQQRVRQVVSYLTASQGTDVPKRKCIYRKSCRTETEDEALVSSTIAREVEEQIPSDEDVAKEKPVADVEGPDSSIPSEPVPEQEQAAEQPAEESAEDTGQAEPETQAKASESESREIVDEAEKLDEQEEEGHDHEEAKSGVADLISKEETDDAAENNTLPPEDEKMPLEEELEIPHESDTEEAPIEEQQDGKREASQQEPVSVKPEQHRVSSGKAEALPEPSIGNGGDYGAEDDSIPGSQEEIAEEKEPQMLNTDGDGLKLPYRPAGWRPVAASAQFVVVDEITLYLHSKSSNWFAAREHVQPTSKKPYRPEGWIQHKEELHSSVPKVDPKQERSVPQSEDPEITKAKPKHKGPSAAKVKAAEGKQYRPEGWTPQRSESFFSHLSKTLASLSPAAKPSGLKQQTRDASEEDKSSEPSEVVADSLKSGEKKMPTEPHHDDAGHKYGYETRYRPPGWTRKTAEHTISFEAVSSVFHRLQQAVSAPSPSEPGAAEVPHRVHPEGSGPKYGFETRYRPPGWKGTPAIATAPIEQPLPVPESSKSAEVSHESESVVGDEPDELFRDDTRPKYGFKTRYRPPGWKGSVSYPSISLPTIPSLFEKAKPTDEKQEQPEPVKRATPVEDTDAELRPRYGYESRYRPPGYKPKVSEAHISFPAFPTLPSFFTLVQQGDKPPTRKYRKNRTDLPTDHRKEEEEEGKPHAAPPEAVPEPVSHAVRHKEPGDERSHCKYRKSCRDKLREDRLEKEEITEGLAAEEDEMEAISEPPPAVAEQSDQPEAALAEQDRSQQEAEQETIEELPEPAIPSDKVTEEERTAEEQPIEEGVDDAEVEKELEESPKVTKATEEDIEDSSEKRDRDQKARDTAKHAEIAADEHVEEQVDMPEKTARPSTGYCRYRKSCTHETTIPEKPRVSKTTEKDMEVSSQEHDREEEATDAGKHTEAADEHVEEKVETHEKTARPASGYCRYRKSCTQEKTIHEKSSVVKTTEEDTEVSSQDRDSEEKAVDTEKQPEAAADEHEEEKVEARGKPTRPATGHCRYRKSCTQEKTKHEKPSVVKTTEEDTEVSSQDRDSEEKAADTEKQPEAAADEYVEEKVEAHGKPTRPATGHCRYRKSCAQQATMPEKPKVVTEPAAPQYTAEADWTAVDPTTPRCHYRPSCREFHGETLSIRKRSDEAEEASAKRQPKQGVVEGDAHVDAKKPSDTSVISEDTEDRIAKSKSGKDKHDEDVTISEPEEKDATDEAGRKPYRIKSKLTATTHAPPQTKELPKKEKEEVKPLKQPTESSPQASLLASDMLPVSLLSKLTKLFEPSEKKPSKYRRPRKDLSEKSHEEEPQEPVKPAELPTPTDARKPDCNIFRRSCRESLGLPPLKPAHKEHKKKKKCRRKKKATETIVSSKTVSVPSPRPASKWRKSKSSSGGTDSVNVDTVRV